MVVNANANIDYESHYIYHLTITATDGELTSVSKILTVHVNNTNEPPQVTNPGSILVAEGTTGDQTLYQVMCRFFKEVHFSSSRIEDDGINNINTHM